MRDVDNTVIDTRLSVFSALRVYALRDRDAFMSGLILFLGLIPLVVNLVGPHLVMQSNGVHPTVI